MYKQAIIVVGLVVSFPSVTQAGLVGIGEFLYDIDPVTGVASNPRETDEPLLALAFGDGTLYGLGVDRFFTVDIATGGLNLLGTLEGLGFAEFPRDLAWDSQTGTFFGITEIGGTQGGSMLVSFSLDTLALTTIGLAHGATALAFDDAGTLFALGSGQERFLILDKTDAQVLSSISLSQSVATTLSMAFAPDGALFVGSNVEGATVMHTLDPMTGVMETLGPANVGILSLTYVPEPGTLLLLGSGALALLRRRRRTSPTPL